MGFLPVLLNMDHIPVLVVGAGTVGQRKIAKLLDRDASVTVVSPVLPAALTARCRAETFRWIPRDYQERDLDGMRLVVAATNSAAANRAVVEDARARGILAQDASSRDSCDFQMMAEHWESPFLVTAVSTTGIWPGAAAAALGEQTLDAKWTHLLAMMDSFRQWIAGLDDPGLRAALWHDLRARSVRQWVDEYEDEGIERLTIKIGERLEQMARAWSPPAGGGQPWRGN